MLVEVNNVFSDLPHFENGYDEKLLDRMGSIFLWTLMTHAQLQKMLFTSTFMKIQPRTLVAIYLILAYKWTIIS